MIEALTRFIEVVCGSADLFFGTLILALVLGGIGLQAMSHICNAVIGVSEKINERRAFRYIRDRDRLTIRIKAIEERLDRMNQAADRASSRACSCRR